MKRFKHKQSQKEYAANIEAEERERRQAIAMGDSDAQQSSDHDPLGGSTTGEKHDI